MGASASCTRHDRCTRHDMISHCPLLRLLKLGGGCLVPLLACCCVAAGMSSGVLGTSTSRPWVCLWLMPLGYSVSRYVREGGGGGG
jgi:hypothetical protein